VKLKVLFYLFLTLAVFGFFLTRGTSVYSGLKSLAPYSICETPTAYKIGRVDSRFGVSQKQFSQHIVEAAGIWGKAYGKTLFEEQADAVLTINLVFDERQALTNKLNTDKNQISTKKEELTPKIEEYRSLVANFKKELADFNNQVKYWNLQGGAPEEEFKELQEKQQELEKQVTVINDLAAKLNISSDEINSQINNFNQTINTFNETLTEKPEEGIYDSQTNSIDIYFNVSRDELVHTLAHEFGHVLDMQHVANQKSIMHAKSNTVLIPSQNDLSELEKVCREHTFWENVQERISALKTD